MAAGLALAYFLSACTFENDIIVVDEFYDGYMIIGSKTDPDSKSDFALNIKESYYEVIIDNCEHLAFDSSTFYISTTDSRFCKVTLSKKDRRKRIKTELDRNNYEKAISSCKNCIIKNY